ncbi:hypothetical protein J5U18_11010 [Sphingobacteriaceae bacterium WQ 2009]|uniref:Uncharacterized protein n=1 Tax=Rhinopithecimicrobium faecis TaxID=2820698 RepID=A0A8T4HAE1_9SPHI|nr:hypothetical protein [Sphingobacteriaceae bacterium WQ 2009]
MTPTRIPILMLAVLLFLGCNKESPNATMGSEKLIIRVAGIVDEGPENISLKAASSTRSNSSLDLSNSVINRDLKEVTLQLSSVEEHTNQALSDQWNKQTEEAAATNLVGTPLLASAPKNLLAQTSPNIITMADDISYRLMLYTKDGDDLRFQQSLDLKSGTSTSIDIVKGQQYQWYAYSYNTTDNFPALTNTSNPVLASTFDKELLYDADSFNLQNEGNYQLLIRFRQQLARTGLRINSKGIFGNIIDVKANHITEIPLVASNFNLMEGRFTDIVSQHTVSAGDALTLQVNPTNAEIMEAYYYSSTPATLPTSFQVSITDLTARYEDNSTEILIGENGKNTAPQQLTFGGFSPAVGRSSLGNINLIHGGINLGGVIWARGNLNYENEEYKLRPNGLFTYFVSVDENSNNFLRRFGSTDYWFWLAERPNVVRSNWRLNKVDACARVFPAGTWRMPSNTDFAILTNRTTNRATDFRTRTPNSANSMYAEFYARGLSPDDPRTEKLVFKADGRYDEPSSSLSYETYALFWSSTENTSLLAFGGSIAYYFRVYNSAADVTTLLTSLNSRRYNVRCVRRTT